MFSYLDDSFTLLTCLAYSAAPNKRKTEVVGRWQKHEAPPDEHPMDTPLPGPEFGAMKSGEE